MHPRRSSRILHALLLVLIGAISAVQAGSFSSTVVSADSKISVQIIRSPISSEPESAAGTAKVDLETGKVEIELNHATPNAIYETIFVSADSQFVLGLLSTNTQGEGQLEITLSSGIYAGVFELVRVGVVQFISATVSFIVGVTESTSTTVSSSETTELESETTSSITSGTGHFQFNVEPSFRSISAGAVAEFNLQIIGGSSANVLLTARGIPPEGVAIFTPNTGVIDPEFHSKFTVVTSGNTPAGSYGIMVLALVNGQEFESQVTLEVVVSTTHTSTIAVTASHSLSITLETDLHHYEPNTMVQLRGHVTDNTGSAVAGASVSLQVDGPHGSDVVFLSKLDTNEAGIFETSFRLATNAALGTYTAFATAGLSGHTSATTHTTFVVGSSSTPSVVIKEVYVTDNSAARSAVFRVGQTVLVWVIVENSGAPFEGIIWVQIRDLNGTPVFIQLQITAIATSSTLKVAFGFTVQPNLTLGLYTANALVSDELISNGGTFLASANAQFALTGEV